MGLVVLLQEKKSAQYFSFLFDFYLSYVYILSYTVYNQVNQREGFMSMKQI